MIETELERATLFDMWGDSLTIGTFTMGGQYDEPSSEDLLVQGYAPSFLVRRTDLELASASVGTTVDSVKTHDGRTLGPFRIVTYAQQDDGVGVLLGLEVTS